MNMFEEARSLDGTMKLCHLSQSAMAEKLGVSQSYVANKIRLLSFSERMQGRILAAGISERHARTLLRLTDDSDREEALERIEGGRMSVALTEAMVERMRERECARREWQELDLIAEDRERIRLAERIIRDTVSRLRRSGIGARLDSEECDGRLYLNIAINGVHPV